MATKELFNVQVNGMSALGSIPEAIERGQKLFMDRAGKRFRDSLSTASPSRSGRLKRSWRYEVQGTSRLRFVNDQPYAKAQDRGAFIQPKAGRFLRFTIGSREVFVRQVRLPPQKIGQKGLRGRARIMNEEFAKTMDRLPVAP